MWFTHSTQIVNLPLGHVPLRENFLAAARRRGSLFSPHAVGFLRCALTAAFGLVRFRLQGFSPGKRFIFASEDFVRQVQRISDHCRAFSAQRMRSSFNSSCVILTSDSMRSRRLPNALIPAIKLTWHGCRFYIRRAKGVARRGALPPFAARRRRSRFYLDRSTAAR